MRQTKLTHEKHTALTIKVARHLNYFVAKSVSWYAFTIAYDLQQKIITPYYNLSI